MIRRTVVILALFGAAAQAASASVTVTGRAISGTEGSELNTTVASGSTSEKTNACLRATIDWGDGASSSGTIPTGGSGFIVRGRHTYAQALAMLQVGSRSWFGRRDPASLPDLEYRTCATSTRADAKAAAERMIGRRETYLSGAA